jgi:hypothetical protein
MLHCSAEKRAFATKSGKSADQELVSQEKEIIILEKKETMLLLQKR